MPQGSILRPLLFIIYKNDLTLNIESKVMFSNDTTEIIISQIYTEIPQKKQTMIEDLVKFRAKQCRERPF